MIGEAFDMQDDWLPDEKLQWSSSITGKLGTGAELIVDNLPVGDHVITLLATNSVGLTATATLKLTVTP